MDNRSVKQEIIGTMRNLIDKLIRAYAQIDINNFTDFCRSYKLYHTELSSELIKRIYYCLDHQQIVPIGFFFAFHQLLRVCRAEYIDDYTRYIVDIFTRCFISNEPNRDHLNKLLNIWYDENTFHKSLLDQICQIIQVRTNIRVPYKVKPRVPSIRPAVSVPPSLNPMESRSGFVNTSKDYIYPMPRPISPIPRPISPMPRPISPMAQHMSPRVEHVSPRVQQVSPHIQQVSPHIQQVSPPMQSVQQPMNKPKPCSYINEDLLNKGNQKSIALQVNLIYDVYMWNRRNKLFYINQDEDKEKLELLKEEEIRTEQVDYESIVDQYPWRDIQQDFVLPIDIFHFLSPIYTPCIKCGIRLTEMDMRNHLSQHSDFEKQLSSEVHRGWYKNKKNWIHEDNEIPEEIIPQDVSDNKHYVLATDQLKCPHCNDELQKTTENINGKYKLVFIDAIINPVDGLCYHYGCYQELLESQDVNMNNKNTNNDNNQEEDVLMKEDNVSTQSSNQISIPDDKTHVLNSINNSINNSMNTNLSTNNTTLSMSSYNQTSSNMSPQGTESNIQPQQVSSNLSLSHSTSPQETHNITGSSILNMNTKSSSIDNTNTSNTYIPQSQVLSNTTAASTTTNTNTTTNNTTNTTNTNNNTTAATTTTTANNTKKDTLPTYKPFEAIPSIGILGRI